MMVRLFILLLCFGMHSGVAHAHTGGHGPVDEQQARQIALKVAEQLAERDAGLGFGKLEPSWTGLPIEAVAIHRKGEGYYIVRVEHAGEDRTLFVLMSIAGEVYDANFSGKFQGLE